VERGSLLAPRSTPTLSLRRSTTTPTFSSRRSSRFRDAGFCVAGFGVTVSICIESASLTCVVVVVDVGGV
jgi:hypothetical protein